MVGAGGLASVFQLTAGIAFAINVFRAPHEQQYQRLGANLDAEETLLHGRDGAAVVKKAARVAAIRTDWIVAGHELQQEMVRWEVLIWIGVAFSLLMLLFCSFFADWELAFWWAAALVCGSAAPLAIAISMMWIGAREKLASIERAAKAL
jgi:hypothetical protein